MLERRADGFYVEDVALDRIADDVGTPAWVYSSAAITSRLMRLQAAFAGFDHRICFSVKANSNLSILKLFRDAGAGFDIVSGGELERVLAVEAVPETIIFSGVGKRIDEVDFALKVGIGCFNVESAAELDRLAARAALLGRVAPVSLRINPDIDARTHPYISTGLKESKFGIPMSQALDIYRYASRNPALAIHGIDCHIGSQISDREPLLQAFDAMLQLRSELLEAGIPVRHLDLGGGLGIAYQNEPDFDVEGYGAAIARRLRGEDLQVFFEPGRFLVGNSGLLLTRVEYLKPGVTPADRSFAIVDAAMSELIRPALYSAFHEVVPLGPTDQNARVWDVVGPVCESADFLAKDRHLALAQDQLLAILSAGAYGSVQSSNYNTRPRAVEVLVSGTGFKTVRRRETLRELLANERECL
ncbi:MAG: diaminopimelate decarboxylase [Gammaproteobacteria bacterium]|nr:diaminopimelate decarboxylase [Gammaproteobacteria bacterium]